MSLEFLLLKAQIPVLFMRGRAGCGSSLHAFQRMYLKTNKNLAGGIISTKFGSNGGILGGDAR